MKLYTKSDIERAARLAVLYTVKGDDPEAAISAAARLIADDADDYFDQYTVRKMVEYAAHCDSAIDYDDLFEKALEYARR